MFLYNSSTTQYWSVTLQLLVADQATIPNMKWEVHSYHTRYGSMICHKILQSLSTGLHCVLVRLWLVLVLRTALMVRNSNQECKGFRGGNWQPAAAAARKYEIDGPR